MRFDKISAVVLVALLAFPTGALAQDLADSSSSTEPASSNHIPLRYFSKTAHDPYVEVAVRTSAQQGSTEAACDASRAKGELDASEHHGTAGWTAGGIGMGFALNLIGMSVMAASSASKNPQPKTVPPNTDESCYRVAYSARQHPAVAYDGHDNSVGAMLIEFLVHERAEQGFDLCL